jgi:hypothetical protein
MSTGNEISQLGNKWNKVPRELKKWFRYERLPAGKEQVCWNGEAVLNISRHKMEEMREMMRKKYGRNVLIDADIVYYLIDKIYHLEERVKELEQK